MQRALNASHPISQRQCGEEDIIHRGALASARATMAAGASSQDQAVHAHRMLPHHTLVDPGQSPPGPQCNAWLGRAGCICMQRATGCNSSCRSTKYLKLHPSIASAPGIMQAGSHGGARAPYPYANTSGFTIEQRLASCKRVIQSVCLSIKPSNPAALLELSTRRT